jgi:hypothetical protein
MNEERIISWKGQTFNQVVAGLKMNTNTFSTNSTSNFFLPPPVKHYRREIANTNVCQTRANLVGDSFYQPGGVVTHTLSTPTYTTDFNLTVNKTERPNGLCDTVACSKSADAKRRVRSSGNIKRRDTYYTSSNEYMISRNRTVKQNEYSHIRYGDPTYKPGSPNSIPNIYTPNGINHCAKVFIGGFSETPLFQYQWLDGIVYDFTIADGNYDIGELNTLFQNKLIANKHYYNDTYTMNKVFLFNFVYDTLSDKVQLQCFATNNATIHPTPRYTVPGSAGWVSPDYTVVPVIRILNNSFQTILGISVGNYPAADISGNSPGQRDQQQPANNGGSANNIYIASGNQFFLGSENPTIGTPYVPLYYKPSNSKFATQGSVDSSARLSRLKYDTVTNSANTFMTAYGKQTTNAFAYGVPGPKYTLKDRVGYTNGRTPVVKSSQMVACDNTTLKGG